MNRLKYFGLLFFSLLIFSACEDVIELDLDTTDPQLVIEANLDAGNEVATVILTQSNDFYDNNSPIQITAANISLQSETGAFYELSETTTGIYQVENVKVSSGERVTLSVNVEGILYEATAQVPFPVDLEEIEIVEAIMAPFGGEEADSIGLTAIWQDPVNIENFYRIRTYVDNDFQAEIYTLVTDEFRGDGEEHIVPIRDGFSENTSVTLELMSTDENYYDYFFQVSSVAGEGANATTPYNPEGNFNNDVLGYFGIYYSSALTINL